MRATHKILTIATFAFLVILASSCQEAQSPPTKPQQEITAPKPVTPQPAAPKPAKSQPKPITVDPAKGQPKIEVENPVLDFGKTGPSKKHKGQYKFKNIGTATLKIKEVKPTCGCQIVKLTKKIYEPGESGTINLTFTSPSHEGSVSKYLYIISNDPENPRFELTVKATVELVIITEPKDLKLSLKTENGGIVPITIKSKDGSLFAITNVSTIKKTITADFDPKKKATQFTLNPIVDLDKLILNPTGSITINLNHPDTRIIRVQYVAPPIVNIRGQRIIVQNAAPGKEIIKDVLILSNYNEEIDIESADEMKGIISVAKKEVLSNRIKLKVKIVPPPKASPAARRFSDRIKVKLTNGYEFEVTCIGLYVK